MRIAVIGATGNFGRVVIPRLLRDPATTAVLAVARHEYRCEDPRVSSLTMDVRDPDLVEHLRDCEVVIHLAFAVEELRDKRLSHDINVLGTINVVTAAARAGVRRLVVASSANAYGSAVTDDFVTEQTFTLGDRERYYFHDKAQVEHYVEWFGAHVESTMSIVTLRCAFVIGPDISNTAVDAMCARFAALPEADRACYQFLHQDDLAEAFAVAAFDHSLTGAYNIAPPDRTMMRDMAKWHGQKLISLPMRVAVVLADLLYRLRLLRYSGHWVTAGDISIDPARFTGATGWKAGMSSDDAAVEMLRLNGRVVRKELV